ncbi:MAG: hypothetical protein IAF58_00020 [Leptolyngbya sp.]|nr:hypothetical protein [Candidatus Melainabacteria bacterium]
MRRHYFALGALVALLPCLQAYAGESQASSMSTSMNSSGATSQEGSQSSGQNSSQSSNQQGSSASTQTSTQAQTNSSSLGSVTPWQKPVGNSQLYPPRTGGATHGSPVGAAGRTAATPTKQSTSSSVTNTNSGVQMNGAQQEGSRKIDPTPPKRK